MAIINTINIKTIEKYNGLTCPRCNGVLFFDLICIAENNGVYYGVPTRCCGSDFSELKEDFDL